MSLKRDLCILRGRKEEEGEAVGYFVHEFAFLIWEGTSSLPKQPLLLISMVLAQGAGGGSGGGGAEEGKQPSWEARLAAAPT